MTRNKSQLSLTLIATFPEFRVLTWHNNYLYAAKKYTLFRIKEKDLLEKKTNWEKVAFFRPGMLRKIASSMRLSQRLLRIGFHHLEVFPDKRMIAILDKAIAVLEVGEKEFKTTWRVKRGTRPMGMAITPDSKIYWGEYFNNKERSEVYVYGSEDGGYTWDVVYTFSKGSIRHIHNIIYDSFDDCFWILTGDEGKEPKILRASRDWKALDIVLGGNQQARAATIIVESDGIYYATDTPHEQNYIYHIDRKTEKREEIAKISGPSMYSCKVGGFMFFSTAAEPGRSYYPAACLWRSKDGDSWHKLFEWPKDSWHPKYFQFGNIVLPRGETSDGLLAATGVAVKGMDGKLGLWVVSNNA